MPAYLAWKTSNQPWLVVLSADDFLSLFRLIEKLNGWLDFMAEKKFVCSHCEGVMRAEMDSAVRRLVECPPGIRRANETLLARVAPPSGSAEAGALDQRVILPERDDKEVDDGC